MKNILSKIGDFFRTLIALLALLLLGISCIFLLPVDYIKYKRSLYYKTERKKYKPFAATSIYFEIYNEIIKNKLPINYYANLNNDSLETGWFVFENTLIIPNVFSDFEFDFESKKWNYYDEHDDGKRIIMSLDDYIENNIREANEFAGQMICNSAVVLINKNDLQNLDIAKKDKLFLIYDDNREKVLKHFCNMNL